MAIYKCSWNAWPWRWGHYASVEFWWLFSSWYGFWFQRIWILNIQLCYLFLSVVISSVPDNCQTYYKYFKALACLIIVTRRDWMMQINRYVCVCLHTTFYLPRNSGPLLLCYWNINVCYKCKFCSDMLHCTDMWKGERWYVTTMLHFCLRCYLEFQNPV